MLAIGPRRRSPPPSLRGSRVKTKPRHAATCHVWPVHVQTYRAHRKRKRSVTKLYHSVVCGDCRLCVGGRQGYDEPRLPNTMLLLPYSVSLWHGRMNQQIQNRIMFTEPSRLRIVGRNSYVQYRQGSRRRRPREKCAVQGAGCSLVSGSSRASHRPATSHCLVHRTRRHRLAYYIALIIFG